MIFLKFDDYWNLLWSIVNSFFLFFPRGHPKSDNYCQMETNPQMFPELKPVNSVVCEQTFSFTNHYTNLKAMNRNRYNIFWIYILELHNHYIEDHRLLKVNPLSPFRMEHILKTAMENAMKKMKI